MATGVRGPIRPENQKGTRKLKVGENYFKIKFTDAQVFFRARLFSKAALVLAELTVRDSSGKEWKSLYKLATIKKNTPFHLGLHLDLTAWLPVAGLEKITINLTYKVIRGSPIKKFLEAIDNSGLASVLSVLGPVAVAGTKVTEIVGHILSFLKKEGETEAIFETPSIELDVQKLETGYFVMIGSTTDEPPIEHLEITKNGSLRQSGGGDLNRYSYAVFNVGMLPRLGSEAFRDTCWGELLQLCNNTAVNALLPQPDDNECRRIREKWIENVRLVRYLESNDQSVLAGEFKDIIREAYSEIEALSEPTTKKETFGVASSSYYPDEWQEILGVENAQQLNWAVQDYKNLLTESKQLLELYEQ